MTEQWMLLSLTASSPDFVFKKKVVVLAMYVPGGRLYSGIIGISDDSWM